MKQLTCEMCGSTDMLKEDGVFVCQSCGCKYSVEEAKKMMIEGTVEVQGTVTVDNEKNFQEILNKIFFYIENQKFDVQDSISDQIIPNPELQKLINKASELSPIDGNLALAKLFVDFQCISLEDLIYNHEKEEIINNINYKLILKYGDEDLQKKIGNYIAGNFDYNAILQNNGGYLTHALSSILYCEAKKVELPNSVKAIGIEAFQDFLNLQEIILPPSIESIGQSAFEGCTALTTINIPASITEIEGSAFAYTGLTSFTFPENLSEVPGLCFQECQKLTTVILPQNIRRINMSAFYNCRNLSNVFIGQTKATIEFVSINSLNKFYKITPYVSLEQNVFDYCPCVVFPQKENESNKTSSGGCYVATCVYGSYDCPEVWTLRRFRDNALGSTWYGRMFVRAYYTISPTLVKWFGETAWFKRFWKVKLDRMVAKLQEKGVDNTPYEDKEW